MIGCKQARKNKDQLDNNPWCSWHQQQQFCDVYSGEKSGLKNKNSSEFVNPFVCYNFLML